MMEALISPPPSHLLLSPSSSLPKSRHPLLLRSRRRRHLSHSSSTLSSSLPPPSATASTSTSAPFSNQLEDEEREKFDWFAQWYPVTPICDLDKRRPHAKTVLGLDIVIWWDRAAADGAGRWKVFDDRCPHRLAPLSEGRVDQWGRLQCVYHGWCFDGAGNCKYIPQAPADGPPVHTFPKACASVYPSFEQNKILWFWPSTDIQYKDISINVKPPFIEELDDPSYTSTMGIRDLPYGYEVLIENLMDPAHVRYAHHGIMRVPKSPNKRPDADREGGEPMDITVDKPSVTGFHSKRELGQTKFIAPCVFYSKANLGPRSKPSLSSNLQEETEATLHHEERKLLLLFLCLPVSPGRSRLIYVFPRNFGVWVDKIIPRWMFHIGQNLILDSDLYLLHVEERKIAKIGNANWAKACFVPTKSDAMVIAFRNWFRKYSDNQINWGTTLSKELPPTPPREQLMDRYWSHVTQCRSCSNALKFLQAIEIVLQVISIAAVGVVAASKQNALSAITRNAVVLTAIGLFMVSRWLSHFIYKTFYYHDYDHAFR